MKKRSIQTVLFSACLLLSLNCLPLMVKAQLKISTPITFSPSTALGLPVAIDLDNALETSGDTGLPSGFSKSSGSAGIGGGGPSYGGSGSGQRIIIELSGTPNGEYEIYDLPYQNIQCQTYNWPNTSFQYYGFKFVVGAVEGVYGFHDVNAGEIFIHKFSTTNSPVQLRCVTLDANGNEILSVPGCSSIAQYIVVRDAADLQTLGRLYFTDLPNQAKKQVCFFYDKHYNGVPITVWLQNPPSGFTNPADPHSSTQAQPLKTYPNPFTDLLEVALPGTSKDQDVQISLYDLQGRQVLDQQFPGGSDAYALSTQDVAPGLYVLHARSGNISQVVKVLKAQ